MMPVVVVFLLFRIKSISNRIMSKGFESFGIFRGGGFPGGKNEISDYREEKFFQRVFSLAF